MKIKILIAAIFFLSTFSFVFGDLASAATRVRGYYRSNGTYVQPYYKSSPDRYKYNNYSTKGNYNPYTGKKGYKNW